MVDVGTKTLQERRIGLKGCPFLARAGGNAGSGTDLLSLLGRFARVKTISFAKSTTEKDTGWDLPAKSIVLDVIIEVKAGASGASINVGLLSSESGGDSDGFAASAPCTSQGLVRPQATVTVGNSTAYFSSCTRGVLLCDFQAGTDTNGDEGLYREKPHLSTAVSAKSVSYTTSNHDISGNIHILFLELA